MKKDNTYKIYIFSILLHLIFISCNKSVYVQTDELGTSKFVIYKENYKYIEKTKNTEIEIWGKYYKTDSTIVFEYRDKNKIPYNYLENNIEKSSINQDSTFITLRIVDKLTNEPLPYASVGAKNKLDNYIEGDDTNLDGFVKLKKNKEIKILEIEYSGYAKQKIDYQKYQNYNLVVKMEQIRSGGRRSEGCLVYFIDVLLEYRINKKSGYDSFERNKIIFRKEFNTP